jgi:Protein of unknown function (DUF2798)
MFRRTDQDYQNFLHLALSRERFRQVDNSTEIRGHRQSRAAKLAHSAHPGDAKTTSWRVDPTCASVLVPAIMAIAISLVVSLVETIVRLGFTPSLVPAWITSFAVAVIVAVPTAVLVAPHVQRLVSRITPPRRPVPDALITGSEGAASATSCDSTPLTDPSRPMRSPDTASHDPIQTSST